MTDAGKRVSIRVKDQAKATPRVNRCTGTYLGKRVRRSSNYFIC